MNALETSIINYLWQEGPSTSAEILSGISKQNMAYSTLSLSLRMLEVKGIIGHDRPVKKYRYFAILTKEDFLTGLIADVLTNYLSGNKEEFKKILSGMGMYS